MKADSYAYRDRRNRKRDFRRLWITRINAAARENGMSYSQFIHGDRAGRHRAGPQGAGRHRRARPRDLPPIRRRRPRGVGCLSAQPIDLLRAPRRAPFLCHDDHLQDQPPPHRDPQARPRRARARAAGASSPRARISMRRLTPPGSRRSTCCARAGHRGARAARGWLEVEPALLASVSALALGLARRRRLRAALGRGRPGRSRSRCGGSAIPGNVGTVIRAAHAFGASCVALGPGCADPYGPKAVRASMGAIFACAASRASRASTSCPAAVVALAAGAAERARAGRSSGDAHAAGRRRARRTARRGARAVRRGALDPAGRGRLAERGDGRDGGVVRGD